jgi:DNA polymerase elongation subunit (family B)
MKDKNSTELWDFCLKVEKEMTKLFPQPMALLFEEAIYQRFFILTKKRYMATKLNRLGELDKNLMTRGVLLSRRDNASIVKNLYKEIIMDILNGSRTKDQLVEYIVDYINSMFYKTHNIEDYIVSKSVNSINVYKIKRLSTDVKVKSKRLKSLYIYEDCTCDPNVCLDEKMTCIEKGDCIACKKYRIKSLPAQVQLAEKMRTRGKIVDAGERLQYVITDPYNYNGKMFDKIEDVLYFKDFQGYIKLDYLYYLKLMSNSLDEALFVGFGLKDFVKLQHKYHENKIKINCKIKSLNIEM